MPRISRKTKQERGADRDSTKGPKRTADEAFLDQSDIYAMWKNGISLDDIAETLGQIRNYTISRRTVERDLKCYREQIFALTQNKEDFDKHRKKELAKLDREEAMVMQIWERSLKATIRREVGEVGDKFVDKRIIEEFEDGSIASGMGDSSCLSRLAEIRKSRQSLLSFSAYTNAEDISVAIQRVIAAGFDVTRPKPEGADRADS